MTTFPTEAPEVFRRLVAALRGDGYSSLVSSYVQRENFAHAHAAEMASSTVSRAFWETTGLYSFESLDEWEAALHLPNDAPRNAQQRAERIRVIRAIPAAQASTEKLELLLQLIAPSALLLANTEARIACDRGIAEDAFQILCVLSDADFDDNHKRETCREFVRRAAPYRCGQHGHPRDLVATGHDLRWGDPLSFFDRDAIRQTTELAAGAEAYDNLPEACRYCRVVPYAQLSKLRAADWNRIQDATLMGATTEKTGGAITAGQVRRMFACSVGASSTLVLDSSVDWRERMITGSIFVSASDARPGGAADTTAVDGSSVYMYSGAGGASFDQVYTTNQTLEVNAANGNLRLINGVAATRYYVGVLIGTEVLV